MARAGLIAELLLTRGRTYRYGPHRSQRAELHLPAGSGPHPVVVLIRGGSWSKGHGLLVMRALARDLVRSGWAAWNIEYRRVGEGGGWPATFADTSAAIDRLADVAAPLDLERTALVGHSAGGHLALWAAARERLPPAAAAALGGRPRVPIARVVSLAGVCDLQGAYRRWRGGAVDALMGGSPEQLPERYALADPLVLLPAGAPALLVHGVRDETVSVKLSRAYASAARAAGGQVELLELAPPAGAHRSYIDPRTGAWEAVKRWLEALREREPAPAQASAGQ
ncbi:MAG TPA: alpha/beta hydrolase [Solirubrobacteraceae bacterium]|nr:alpha/beta hydrolase [Solirubrobacteraceae bacterium]